MLTVLDFFSGCGGLSSGFGSAGFKVLRAFDNWEPAVATYNTNFSHGAESFDLSRKMELPYADVIVGGPPCQGFSSAGRRVAGDERNTLVRIFAEWIGRIQPRAFVFENVEGFLTQDNFRFLLDLLEPLVSFGYRIHTRKINAAHFGVPQHRKRVLAIGGLGWDPTFPGITHSATGMPGASRANLPTLPKTPTIMEAIGDLPAATPIGTTPAIADHTFQPLSPTDMERARLLGPGQRMRDLPEHLWHDSYKRRAFRRVMDGTPSERRGGAPAGLRRLRGDEPAKAITGGALRDFLHPVEDRALTVRECARLQTFSDNFEFVGTQAEKIQMIGNAVPPLLACRIAETLYIDLNKGPSLLSAGKLLSFVPTMAEGKSPILESVCERIENEFALTSPIYQPSLWP